ncbi:MAG: hypothetical protein EXX96DRAFT_613291 [Benjaminiella poitrasii]|nr:MAG: hypothetical protein EXX96DRAFT_613291 [Benjaminiella poitrasii]
MAYNNSSSASSSTTSSTTSSSAVATSYSMKRKRTFEEEETSGKRRSTVAGQSLRRSARIAALVAQKEQELALTGKRKLGDGVSNETNKKRRAAAGPSSAVVAVSHGYYLRSLARSVPSSASPPPLSSPSPPPPSLSPSLPPPSLSPSLPPPSLSPSPPPQLPSAPLHLAEENGSSSSNNNNSLGADSSATTIANTDVGEEVRLAETDNFDLFGLDEDFSILAGPQEDPPSPPRAWFDEQAVFVEGLPTPEPSWD